MLFMALTFNACSDVSKDLSEEAEISLLKNAVEHLNTSENRQAILEILQNSEEAYHPDYDLDTVDLNEQISNYERCSECPNEIKQFMLPLLQDMANIEDDNLLQLIYEYQEILVNYDSDYVNKQNLEFLLYSFEQGAIFKLGNSSLQQRVSRNRVATGLAWGFLSGCAYGAYVGGTAGTFTVPVIGTVTGAVAGCIAGGAFSGVIGAAGGAFWSIFD